jgi:hypothetical protein
MKNKKGIEIQFNWIFVLIAGAMILLFVTLAIVKQKDVSQTTSQNTVMTSLEAVISGTSVSSDTIKAMDLPLSKDIDVKCGKISMGGPPKTFQNSILFAPSILRGNRLLTQTLKFSSPFRSANLLYMTSPQVRYIIIRNGEFSLDINRSLSSEINKEVANPTALSIQDKNNYKVKFIFFNQAPGDDLLTELKKMDDSDVTAINIVGDEEKGTIEFYEKKNLVWQSLKKSPYLSKSALIGAIYADSKELYECNLKRAVTRLKIVNEVYTNRVIALSGDASLNNNCINIVYDPALTTLNEIGEISNAITSSANLDIPNFNLLSAKANELVNHNKIAQRFSCPLIY